MQRRHQQQKIFIIIIINNNSSSSSRIDSSSINNNNKNAPSSWQYPCLSVTNFRFIFWISLHEVFFLDFFFFWFFFWLSTVAYCLLHVLPFTGYDTLSVLSLFCVRMCECKGKRCWILSFHLLTDIIVNFEDLKASTTQRQTNKQIDSEQCLTDWCLDGFWKILIFFSLFFFAKFAFINIFQCQK